MSRRATKKKAAKKVKCAYCGRENIPVTSKGYMKPHVKTDGRPCLHVHVVPYEQLTGGQKSS